MSESKGFFRRLWDGFFETQGAGYEPVDEEIEVYGSVVPVVRDVAPDNDEGRIELRGTTWKATSISEPIAAGEEARVVYRDNLVWFVEQVRGTEFDELMNNNDQERETICMEGGERAVQLRLSEAYIDKLRGLARRNTKVLLPADLTSVDEILKNLTFDFEAAPVEPALKATARPRPSGRSDQAPRGIASSSGGRASSDTQPIPPMGSSFPRPDEVNNE